MGKVGNQWLSLMAASSGGEGAAAFGLPHPVAPDHPQVAEILALSALGLCQASIKPDVRYRRSAKKAARDAVLERDTIHMAPTWRHAEADETGIEALILPVGQGRDGRECSLSLIEIPNEDDFAEQVIDLIAIPLDGSRPLSWTGHTLAIGNFAVDEANMVLFASPLEWLKVYLARARETAAMTPKDRAEKLDFIILPPESQSTLLVEPLGLEWRVSSSACVIPPAARNVTVRDSRKLAELIDALVRRKLPTRTLPIVRGPKEKGLFVK
jgi:hypothetical protein